MTISKLRERVEALMRVEGRYGVAPEEGRQPKDTVHKESGVKIFSVNTKTNVATVAAANEFGSKRSRPAFRRSYTVREGDLKTAIQDSIRKMVRGEQSGEEAMQQISTAGGELVVDEIATTPSWAKPNSRAWIEIKDNEHPLIATGQEITSISGSVLKDGEEISKENITPNVTGSG